MTRWRKTYDAYAQQHRTIQSCEDRLVTAKHEQAACEEKTAKLSQAHEQRYALHTAEMQAEVKKVTDMLSKTQERLEVCAHFATSRAL
ncbi:hypothetical protein CYMTET_37801 [Cymbomonas tetramitiformis]|uniref:Uncharacterized protein n=1 Tax=Cymbomonas tetramitiformis TaxID=36881 RepID=A0AAE0CEQ3_9CHLO|nr:hypothetical protein CYMTET_37801 [Cymbomonas tetramitiformis]